MERETAKKLLKLAVVIYLASFFIINWNDVSWVFNYRTVYGLVTDFFNPYPSIDAGSMNAYFYPNSSQNSPQINSIAANITYTEKQNGLEVPKIDISVPIVFAKSQDTAQLTKDLDSGVVYYPGSVYPGELGQIIILGHSAPPGWPKVKHDWVFTDLNKLAQGDKIFINLDNKQYTYLVKDKTIIQKGADVPEPELNTNVLVLISCWPPGKDYQRIVVQAELLTN